MDIKTIKKITPILLKHNIVPYWHGMQGVGKTSVAHQIGKEMGFDSVIPLELGTNADASDLVGLLIQENGRHYHTRPDWMPTEGRHLIFLDEFNRAQGDIYQVVFTLLTEGRIKNHRLPPGCRIIAAANYDSNDFTVSNTRDKALRSRFCHLHFVPTTNEIADFIEEIGTEGHKEVARFLRVMPEMAGSVGGTMNISPDPDPRSWASKIGFLHNEDLGDARFEVYSGLIGPVAAASFFAFGRRAENPLNIVDILENYRFQRDRVLEYAKIGEERRYDTLNIPIDQLFEKLDADADFLAKPGYINSLKEFILDLPLELIMKVTDRMGKTRFNHRSDFINNEVFTDQLVKLMTPTIAVPKKQSQAQDSAKIDVVTSDVPPDYGSYETSDIDSIDNE